jgi:hypothetical protein
MPITREPKPIRKPTPSAAANGRWFLVLLGLAVAALGVIFVWLLGKSFLRAKEMRTWPQVECIILSSEIEERRNDPNARREFRHNLIFGYEWNGEARTGNQLTLRGSPWSSRQAEVVKRHREYPVGKKTTCIVDPTNQNFAVLKPDSLAPGYSIWFPTLFVIGGLGISIRALRSPTQKIPRINS